jgi:hypothetical protein
MTDYENWTGFATVLVRADTPADGGAEAKYKIEDALNQALDEMESITVDIKDAKVEQLDVKKLED